MGPRASSRPDRPGRELFGVPLRPHNRWAGFKELRARFCATIGPARGRRRAGAAAADDRLRQHGRVGYEQLQWIPEAAEFVNVPAIRTCMVDPSGALWTYTFNYRGDLLDERVRLTRDGSFRVAITRREFDADGHLTALTLPDGSRTEWTYDTGNKDPRAHANLLRVELRAAGLLPVPGRVVLRATCEPTFQQPRDLTYETGLKVRLRYDLDLALGTRGELREVPGPIRDLKIFGG